MNKKVIFLDIDGTLTEPGKNVPPESAVTAVKKAQENGHKVFLCTGRNFGMLSPLLPYGFDGVVGSSGGYITCGDEVVYDCPMTREESDRLNEVLLRNNIFRTIECKDGSYTDEGFKDFLRANAEEGGNSELLRWREQIESSLSILPMAEYQGDPIYKIVCMATRAEQMDEPKALLSDDFLVVIQDTDKFGIVNGEILSRRYDKGQAVERVCEFLGVPVEDSVGFGDSNNDKEMLEVAGTAVVMENGTESMKKLADYVCPAVTEDGLYKAFVKLGLIEED